MTASPTNLVLTPGSDIIFATWTRPNGSFSGYYITTNATTSSLSPISIAQYLEEWYSWHMADGLTPGTTYVVSIYAIGSSGYSDPVTQSVTTISGTKYQMVV